MTRYCSFPHILLILVLVMASTTSQHAVGEIQNTSKAADPDINIYYWHRNYDSEVMQKILRLALEKTEDFNEEISVYRGSEITQGRAIKSLSRRSSKEVNLINVVPDETRIQALLPIYIAGDAGIMGLRVCLIKKQDSDKFSRIRALADLQKSNIVFGQSEHWPDTKILRDNGFKVVTTAVYEPLYAMLRAGRFNCFLRGVGEIRQELELYGGDDLSIEPSIVFSYPSTSLFFVNKKNKKLAARIELGLRRAVLDGSFSQFFEEHYQPALQELNLSSRRIIRLNNSLFDDIMLKKLTRPLEFSDAKLTVY